MHDRLLASARLVLKGVNALNWVAVAMFAIGILLSGPFADRVLHVLAAKYRGMDVMPVLWTIRAMAVLGIAVGIAAHVIFTRLRAIVDTARAGDPFVAANARRLQAIGWALLAIQLLDLAYGALTAWMAVLRVDRLDWTPSLGGWIAVLMVFVLARVFAVGAGMRDDLAMTV